MGFVMAIAFAVNGFFMLAQAPAVFESLEACEAVIQREDIRKSAIEYVLSEGGTEAKSRLFCISEKGLYELSERLNDYNQNKKNNT